MKQLLILSGKGGTGKTTIASAFIKLSSTKSYADCDVDAPNLHLVSKQNDKPLYKDYFGLPKAVIDENICVKCGDCERNCQFNAIHFKDNYTVNAFECEGCGVCENLCPVKAITLSPSRAGDLMLYQGNDSVFSTAQLKMGSGTSGKLVTEVKKQMRSIETNSKFAVIDGSPGIGCPVIASLSGVDMVLIVTEPSISGMSDMERIIKTAEKFDTKIAVCVNKYDTNLVKTNKIKEYCMSLNISFVGVIPFDTNAVKAINNGKTIIDIDCSSGDAVKNVYEKTISLLLE